MKFPGITLYLCHKLGDGDSTLNWVLVYFAKYFSAAMNFYYRHFVPKPSLFLLIFFII